MLYLIRDKLLDDSNAKLKREGSSGHFERRRERAVLGTLNTGGRGQFWAL